MNLLSWKLALRSLLRNKRRSISTGVAMTAGFVGLVLLSAYILRVQRGLAASAVYLNFKGHVSIYHKSGVDQFFAKPSKFQMTEDEVGAVEDILKEFAPSIEFTGKFISGTGLLSVENRSTPVYMTGFQPETYEKAYNHPTLKKWSKDWLYDPNSPHDEFIGHPERISITRSLADIIGKKVVNLQMAEKDKDVQLAGRTYTNDLNAVNAELGMMHSTGVQLAEDTSLLAPLELLQNLFDTHGIHYYALFLKNDVSSSKIRRQIEEKIKARHLDLEVFEFDNEKVSYFYVGTMGFLYVMGSFFIFLILGAVVLSIVNSMIMGIIERSKEIGTLRAMGFQQIFIQNLFIKEAVWLSLFSIIAGSIVAFIIAEIVNALNIRFNPPGVASAIQFFLAMDVLLVLGVGFIVMLTAILTAYFVVKNKVNLKIVDLLTETGA